MNTFALNATELAVLLIILERFSNSLNMDSSGYYTDSTARLISKRVVQDLLCIFKRDEK